MQGWSEFFGDTYVRSWPNFSAAADEANVARIYSGFHFRFAIRDGREKGDAIGVYVVEHAAQPLNDRRTGQLAQ